MGGFTSRPTPALLTYLAQPARLDFVDEAAHGFLVRDKRARLDARHGLAHVFFEIRESFERELRLDADLSLYLALHLVVFKGEHPAVGVVDQDDLARAQQALRYDERPDLVVRNDASRVAYDVRVALLETEHPENVQPRIHASD